MSVHLLIAETLRLGAEIGLQDQIQRRVARL
jgi:hypothetical protein